MVTPLAEETAPVVTGPAAVPASPLVPMAGRNDGSSAPKTLLNRPRVRAAQKDHTVKHVLLINALLMILFLSDTWEGRVHEKRIADATLSPLPAGSRQEPALDFLEFTLPQVDILMPTKKPRSQELTLEQHVANQALHCRRLPIEHVNSSVQRCRIVKDRSRLWQEGVRDVVMDICCALPNFRVRLTPWQRMV